MFELFNIIKYNLAVCPYASFSCTDHNTHWKHQEDQHSSTCVSYVEHESWKLSTAYVPCMTPGNTRQKFTLQVGADSHADCARRQDGFVYSAVHRESFKIGEAMILRVHFSASWQGS